MVSTPNPSGTRKKTPKTPVNSEIKLVKELTNILVDAGLTEIEYENKTVAIRLSRAAGGGSVATGQVAAPLLAPTDTVEATTSVQDLADHPGAVTSPMVGTVYTAPEPGVPGFVSEGDSVKVGQTLFIVEAMKVMNPITAPAAGTIVKILVQNAQPVEFGQALLILE